MLIILRLYFNNMDEKCQVYFLYIFLLGYGIAEHMFDNPRNVRPKS